MKDINEFLGLPKGCYINARMPKKTFTDNPEFDLKREEKSILKDYINSIYLVSSLKPSLLNIPSFEDENVRYEEIEIFKIIINNENKYSKPCELLQKYIQYPMIIMIECNDFIRINAAIKKINKNDSSKLIIDEMIYTDWINKNDLKEKELSFLKSLNIRNLNTNNLFNVYEGYVNCIKSFIATKYSNKFQVKSIEELSNNIQILDKINNLENEVTSLRNDIKKETNMGAKVELNVKIKKVEKQIENLKNTLI